MTVSNSNNADFLTLASEAGKDARSNLIGGTVRLRDMTRNLFLAATALDSKATVDGLVTDLRKALAWDKPRDWTTTAGGGAKRTMTADEVARIKSGFDACFTHVRFFVGEYTATDVADDVKAIRTALESGEMAFSTAYKAIRSARKAAEKLAAEAAEKAEAQAAQDALTSELPARDPAAEAADAEAEADAALVDAIMALAERLSGTAVPLSPEVIAAMQLLDTAMQDACDRNDALLASDAPMVVNG